MCKPSESCRPTVFLMMGSMIAALWLSASAVAEREAAEMQAREYSRPLSQIASGEKPLTEPQLILAEDPGLIDAADTL
jgi:hypothetical protein